MDQTSQRRCGLGGVIPVVTPSEMAEVDAAAPEPTEVLIERAGAAVAREALRMLGGSYGRRVVVIAGRGNNGADGRSAARRLIRRGVSVSVLDATELPPVYPPADLVIDAAYGTGFRGSCEPPSSGRVPVLAVDIASGVDALTGLAAGVPLRAEVTVTFAALKPGLLLADGPGLCGEVRVVDIGLDVGQRDVGLVTDDDLVATWPCRPRTAHKWQSAVWVIGGSPGMTGAPILATRGVQACGGGYVRLSVPGGSAASHAPTEAVMVELPVTRFDEIVMESVDRFGSLVIGPGLGRSAEVSESLCRLVRSYRGPMVIDGDGLAALADEEPFSAGTDVVLTPHDGEYERIAGRPVGDDRIADARRLAVQRRAVVLLKGPTTVVANPGGEVALVTSGDQRLATAGTGDVLAGMIGALLAQGAELFDAAWMGAHAHGLAGRTCRAVGTTATDVADAVPAVLARLLHGSSRS